MKKNKWILIGVTVTTLSAYSAEETSSWNKRMKEMQSTLQELLVDISSDERFKEKSTQERVGKNAKKLATLASNVSHAKQSESPDQDPSIHLIAGLFASETKQAAAAFEHGQKNYARNVLRSVTGYCFSCHTRKETESSVNSNRGLEAVANTLSGLERAELYASTRQFDRALDAYEKIISDSTVAKNQPFQWEKAIRHALVISVRVKKDPDRSLDILKRVQATPTSPYFLKEQATQWEATLQQWKKEAPRELMTEEGHHSEALRLIAEAKKLQRYPADRSADILYLRATAMIHDMLKSAPNGKHAAEGLYLAGLSYEVLQDLQIWELHDLYYRACVHKAPRTPVAQDCYRHYEQSIYLGYSGSGGTSIPSEIRKTLSDLKSLAFGLPITGDTP